MVSNGGRGRGLRCSKASFQLEERTVSDLLGIRSLRDRRRIWLRGESGRFAGCSRCLRWCWASDLAETPGRQVGDSVLVTSPQGELTPIGSYSPVSEVSRGGDLSLGLLSVRLGDGVHAAFGCAAAFQRAGSDLGDQLQGGRSLQGGGRWVGRLSRLPGRDFMTSNWMDDQPGAVSRAGAGKDRHLHHHRADCAGGGAEYSDRTDHDGDGEDAGYCGADELWRAAGAGAADFSDAGLADQPAGYGGWAGAGLCGLLGGGHYHIPLSADVYNIDTLPFAPSWTDGVLVAAVSIGVSLLATLYPFFDRGADLPAEALRYE
jgi:lipoprotein-releasing system permease protein